MHQSVEHAYDLRYYVSIPPPLLPIESCIQYQHSSMIQTRDDISIYFLFIFQIYNYHVALN